MPAAEFPLLDSGGRSVEGAFEVACSRLADSFAGVEHAISTDDTRYYLNGVYVHPGEDFDLRFAATDGSRLARLALDGPDGAASFPPLIIAKKTVGVLDKLLAAAVKTAGKDSPPPAVLIEALAGGTLLRFSMPASDDGEVELIAKTIDGRFPDYQRVIPVAPDHRVTVARAALTEVIKRVTALASDKTRTVVVRIEDDRMTLSTATPELGDASEELPCSYAADPITFGLNGDYWRQALAAIGSDAVAMGITDESAAIRVSGWEDGAEAGGLLQVLMPVRI